VIFKIVKIDPLPKNNWGVTPRLPSEMGFEGLQGFSSPGNPLEFGAISSFEIALKLIA
jgi:hypothetical protein